MEVSAMIIELVNYYLTISHKDISESLKEKTDEEIIELYNDTFGDE